MRKVTTLVLITLFVFFSVPLNSSNAADSNIVVFLDGKQLIFDVPPSVVDNRTMVPLRSIFESLGAIVEWDQGTQTAIATKGGLVVSLTVGENVAYINGEKITLDVPSKVINQRTLVPLRFVSESLKATVGWLGKSRVVTINTAAVHDYPVSSITDGDTIKIVYKKNEDGKDVVETVRFIGMDTPESVHPDQNRNTEAGKVASAYTKKALENAEIKISYDVEERDRYSRLLGYVFLQDGTFYNEKLVEEGYARLATFPPNVQWVDLFTYLQKDAREHKRGFWADGDEF